ncbi:hypothetical protein M433DRAFT_1733 [Acidomyces richmondensis BFW]|nr:MAG: hypothetical protein FE78DRAFT_66671 [Acidomyces sp. 'richmondensis']KYG48755.1 hypothetical protein M433DRAFT_1733 [Acidomyces richmondensis BFW]
MHQAQVNEWGLPPRCTEVSEPPPPGAGEVRVKVKAVGVHRVVRSRAAGKHYTSGTPPHIPGIDGVGTTEDNQTVYWASFDTPSMVEYVNLPAKIVKRLPTGTDPVQAAGMINPAMSSWMAFKSRAEDLPPDFTVLILGATSASGRVAIPLARALGAKRVVGAARNKAALDDLGLDASIVIAENATETDFSALGDVDVILDYVYGPLTVHLFNVLKSNTPVQYVHIGSLAALEISLPGAVLRSKNLTIRGSGPGAWSMQEVVQSMDQLLPLVKDLPKQPIKTVRLEDVEKAWNSQNDERLVVVME